MQIKISPMNNNSNIQEKTKYASVIFKITILVGLVIGIIWLGVSFMIFDHIDNLYVQLRSFVQVGPIFLYLIPTSFLFRSIYRKSNNMVLSLTAFILPFVLGFGTIMYYDNGPMPTSILPNTDFRHFAGTPAFSLVCSINYDHSIKDDSRLSLNYVEDISGMSPLIFSIRNKKYNAAIELLELGADPNVVDSHNGISPLLELCINYDENKESARVKDRLIELLLEKNADVNCCINNTSPLFALCRSKYADVELISLLISRGANTNQLFIQSDPYLHECYKENESALNIAVYQERYDVALLLLENGADPTNYEDWMLDIIKRKTQNINDINAKELERIIIDRSIRL